MTNIIKKNKFKLTIKHIIYSLLFELTVKLSAGMSSQSSEMIVYVIALCRLTNMWCTVCSCVETNSRSYYLLWGILQRVGQPIKAFIQTLSICCTCGLYKPLPVPHIMQAEFVRYFLRRHGIWQILQQQMRSLYPTLFLGENFKC